MLHISTQKTLGYLNTSLSKGLNIAMYLCTTTIQREEEKSKKTHVNALHKHYRANYLV